MTAHKFVPKADGTTTFGLHLMLDAYEANEAALGNMQTVFSFLKTLPARIGMNALTPPFVIEAEDTGTGFDPGGVTGFVIIAESHVSIHTFPKRGFFTMDVYSCSDFTAEVETLMQYTKEVFGFGKHQLQTVTRGNEYPLT